MSEERIRELAYLKWETAGYPQCDGVEFWLQAEDELTPKPQRTSERTGNLNPAKVAAKATSKRK